MNEGPAAVAELQPCPECSSMIPADPRYPRWCEQCGWNLHTADAAPEDLFTKLVARVSRRKSPELHKRMMCLSPGDEPRRGKATVASFVLATTVYLPFVVLTALGLSLIIGQWFDLFSFMWGLILTLSGLTLIPRFSRLPDAGLLHPDSAPELFALLHGLCKDAGGTPIDTVVVDTSYNAWSGRMGWRHERSLGLGLPLVSVLEPQEFVALLSHEVGHSVNGDALRGAYIGNALDISLQSYWAFRYGLRGPLRAVSRAVSFAPWWVALGLVTLQFSSSQEAEYRADSVASGMAGSEALVGLLRKVLLHTSYETAYVRSGGNLTQLIDDLSVRVKSVPDREIERQLRITQLPGARHDRTHPPTAWRVEFAKQREATPRITLDERTFAAIVGELKSIDAATPLAYRQRRQRGL